MAFTCTGHAPLETQGPATQAPQALGLGTPLSGKKGGGSTRDALEGKEPQRRPQRRLGRRLEEVAKAVGGGYYWSQMPRRPAFAVRETVAGHRLGTLKGGGGGWLPPFQCIRRCLSYSRCLCASPPSWDVCRCSEGAGGAAATGAGARHGRPPLPPPDPQAHARGCACDRVGPSSPAPGHGGCGGGGGGQGVRWGGRGGSVLQGSGLNAGVTRLSVARRGRRARGRRTRRCAGPPPARRPPRHRGPVRAAAPGRRRGPRRAWGRGRRTGRPSYRC